MTPCIATIRYRFSLIEPRIASEILAQRIPQLNLSHGDFCFRPLISSSLLGVNILCFSFSCAAASKWDKVGRGFAINPI